MKRTSSKVMISVCIFLAIFLSVSTTVIASDGSDYYTDSFPLQTYDFRMYVVSLELGDIFIVNVTAVADGEFDLFLFNTRPQKSMISRDGYDPEIFNNITGTTLLYDINNGTFSSIEYSPNNPLYPVALYYLQVVMIDRGPDSYTLEANHEMELYFIPFIPGYPIVIVIGISFLTGSVIFFCKRKSMIKL